MKRLITFQTGDFVIRKGGKEIVQLIVPYQGTEWRVVEFPPFEGECRCIIVDLTDYRHLLRREREQLV